MSLVVHTVCVSPFDQNARVLLDNQTMEAVIIDPGADVDKLFELIKEYRTRAIFLTHCHLDHAGGVQALLELYDQHSIDRPTLIYHSNEIIIGQHIETFGLQYGFSSTDFQNTPPPDQPAETIAELNLGDYTFQLLFTPGHSPGHVALYLPSGPFTLTGTFPDMFDCNSLLIAGDTLFSGSIGRTDLPMGNHEQLLSSIRSQLFTLPDTTLVCSGHGPNTTIGHEKSTNPFL